MNFKKLPEITKKQEEIIGLVWKFRFINRHQLQKHFKYKSPRRLNEWLKDLVEKGYLGRIYSHKLLENTKPAIYFLMNNAIIYCKHHMFREEDVVEGRDVKKYYEDKHALPIFINHCISICTIYQQFMDLNSKEWDYYGSTRNEMWVDRLHNHRAVDYEGERIYLPDLHVSKSTNIEYQDGDHYEMANYVVELFDSYIPQYALEGKARLYIELCTKNRNYYFSLDDSETLTIMLIFTNAKKMGKLKKYIEEKLYWEFKLHDLTFKLAMLNKVMEKGIQDENIWKIIKTREARTSEEGEEDEEE